MTKIAQRLAAFALYGLLLTTALTGCSARGITGSITDNSTGLALTGVQVTVGDLQATTDDKGSYKLTLPLGTQHVQARLAGYRTFETDVTLDNKTRQVKLDISLQQRQLAGIVREEQQGALLGGVTVQIGDSSATTDDQGAFTLPVLPDNAITITKSGYYSTTLDAAAVAALFDENGALISAYEATLKPRVVTGRLSEEGNGSPIAGTSIQIGEQKTTTDSSGAFTLSQVEPGQAITISAAAYRIPDGLTYNGEAELNLALKPYQAAVSISDAESGEALPEATLAAEAGDLSLQPDGRYLARVVPGTIMTASLVGYKNSTLTYNGEEELVVKLTPAQLVGQLTAADTGEPISGAVVLAYTQLPEPVVLRSDESGRFYYPEDNTVNEILVKAPGYERVSLPITRTGMLRLSLAPFEAKALYIPFGLLYDRAALEAVLDLAEGTEMNAIVVDMKDDWATVAWDSQVPLAIEVGAYNKDVMDAKDVIALAHERGLYVIGRMVVFKDDHLARAHPEYAVQRYSGGYYTDLEGLMWVDPFRPEVQQYNIDLAVELANLGIDEVQYDYIRFPSDGSVTGLLYSQEANYESRTRVIAQFISASHEALMKTPAFFSVDVFGLVPWVEPGDDMGIGQTMEDIAPYVDYLCPMLYPTTFGPGELGYATPGIYPYEIVYRSVMAAHERTSTKIRPWLQHYSIYGIEYGVVERLQQRKAADDANSCGWTYWNAAGWYERSSLEADAYSQYPAVSASTPETMR